MIFINRQLLDFGFLMQLKDMKASFLITVVVGSLLALSNLIPVGTSPVGLFVSLVCQALVYAVLYFGLAFVFKTRALREVAEIALPKISKRFPAFVFLHKCLCAK